MREAVDDAWIHGRGDFPSGRRAGLVGMTTGGATAHAAFERLFADHVAVFERSRSLLKPAAALAEAAISVLRAGGKLLLCGNGGSAADSQHIATEFTVRFETSRPGLAAIALTTDTSALTAAGNDLGFERIFARQIEALGRPGDLALGISTSGRSQNVIAALEAAKRLGLTAAAFTGGDGGLLNGLADPILIVPSRATDRIQEMHITLGQMLCAALEIELGLV